MLSISPVRQALVAYFLEKYGRTMLYSFVGTVKELKQKLRPEHVKWCMCTKRGNKCMFHANSK